MPSFEYNGKIYDVPDDAVEGFLSRKPSAKQINESSSVQKTNLNKIYGKITPRGDTLYVQDGGGVISNELPGEYNPKDVSYYKESPEGLSGKSLGWPLSSFRDPVKKTISETPITEEDKRRISNSVPYFSAPNIEAQKLKPFENKTIDESINRSRDEYASDPYNVFKAQYEGFKKDPELYRTGNEDYSDVDHLPTDAQKLLKSKEEVRESRAPGQPWMKLRTKVLPEEEQENMLDFLKNTKEGQDAVKNFNYYNEILNANLNSLRDSVKFAKEDFENKWKINTPSKIKSFVMPGSELIGLSKEEIDQRFREEQAIKNAERELEQGENLIKAIKDKDLNILSQFGNEFGRGFSNTAIDALSYGIKPLIDIVDKTTGIDNLQRKIESGDPLTKLEQLFADALATNQAIQDIYSSQKTTSQKVAEGIESSIPYMATFGLLSAPAKLATRGASSAAKSGIKNLATSALRSGVNPTVAKTIARAAGFGVGTLDVAGRSAIMSLLDPRTIDKAIEYSNGQSGYEIAPDTGQIVYTGQEDGLSLEDAAGKTIVTHMIENFAEHFGLGFAKIGNSARRVINKNAPELGRLLSLGSGSQFYQGVNNLMKKAGFNGTIEEFLEEQVSTILNAAFTGEAKWSDLIDPEQQLVTFLTVASIGSGASIANRTGNAVVKRNIRRGYEKSKQSVDSLFPGEIPISEIMDSATIEEKQQMLSSILGGKYSEDQKKAALNYYEKSIRYDALKGGIRGKIENEINNVESEIANLSNPDMGSVVTVRTGYADSPVNIVGGNLSISEDGTIDKENSSKVLYYLDENGKRKMMPVDDVMEVVDIQNSDESFSQLAQEVVSGISNQEASELFDEDFQPGESVFVNINESQVPATVLGVDESGALMLRFTSPDGTESVDLFQSDMVSRPEDMDGGQVAQLSSQAVSPPEGQYQNGAIPQGEQGNLAEVPSVPFIDQIPKDERGNLLFEQAPFEATVGALSEMFDSPQELRSVVEAAIVNNQKQIDKVSAFKPTGDIQKDIANKQKAKAELQALQSRVDYWNGVLSSIPQTKESVTQQLTGQDTVVPSEINSESARLMDIARNSNDIQEIASVYDEAMQTAENENLQDWERGLIGRRVNRASFERFGDRNKVNGVIARSWFNRKGEDGTNGSIDVIAEELGVTEQDVIDFILSHPLNRVQKGNDVTKALNDRFKQVASELTGYDVGGIESASGKMLLKGLEIGNDLGRQESVNNSPLDVPDSFVHLLEAADIDIEKINTFEELESAINEAEQYLWQFSPEEFTEIKNIINHARQTESYARTSERIKEAVSKRAVVEDFTKQQEKTGTGEDVTSGNNINFAENIENEQGNKIPERVPQRKHRAVDEVYSRIEEISDRIQRGIESAEKELEGRKLTQHEREDLEKRIVFGYAKENDLWVDDIYSLGTPTEVRGNENTLAYNESDGTLYKSNNLFNSNFLISNLLKQTEDHNRIFPNTKYELVGFTGIDNGNSRAPYVEVVLKQDFVKDSTKATPEEISNYMHALGFNQVNEHTFTNAQYTVSDLHPRNVLKNENGDIFVVDDIVKKNKQSNTLPEFTGDLLGFINNVSKQQEIEQAEAETNVSPTESQKEAGNYKKGHVNIQGLDISIEQPKGSIRSGKDASGKEWSVEMKNTYGYIRGTESKDGDHVDVFIGNNPNSGKVFVVDQVNQDGSFDEHKVMLGFDSLEEAKVAYLSNYEEGWRGLGDITETSVDDFKKWAETGTRKIKPFAEYRSIKNKQEVIPETGRLYSLMGPADIKPTEYKIDYVNSGQVRLYNPRTGFSKSIWKEEFPEYFKRAEDFTNRLQSEQTPEQINSQFNSDLQQQIDGTLPKGHIYQLGMPGEALLSSGIENLPIEMPANRLEIKSSKDYKSDHPFDLSEVENLPQAINNPIAVFESDTDPRKTVVLTELKSGNNNFIAVLGVQRKSGHNVNEVNQIISLYPKNSDVRVSKWFEGKNNKEIGKDLLLWVDKEKAFKWLSNASTNVSRLGQSPKRIAKVIQNFENPNVSDKKHISSGKFKPISKSKFGKLIDRLKQTGLANDVVTSVKEVQKRLEEILSKKKSHISFQTEKENAIDRLRNTEFIETGETRIDEDYDPGDSEYNQRKVYVPVYQTKWYWADNTDPEIYDFDSIDDAISDSKVEGDTDSLDKYFEPYKELVLGFNEAWVDSENNIIDQDDSFINGDDWYHDNRNNLVIDNFFKEIDPVLDTTFFSGREESAQELENEVYDNISKDIIKEIEVDGKKYQIETDDKGKYRDITVYDENDSIIGTIQLRISDHSYNPANNNVDWSDNEGFISVEIANVNETKGKFNGKYGLSFDGENTYEDVAHSVNERVREIIDGWDFDKPRLFSTSTGEIYGWVETDGAIYLDQSKMNANTPIHEFAHLWQSFIENNNPELYQKGYDLIKDSPYMDRVRSNPAYSNLSEKRQVDEAMAMAIGDKGELVVNKKGLGQKLLDWINDVWGWIGSKLGIRNLSPEQIQDLTLEQFTEGAVADLLSGKEINQKNNTNFELNERKGTYKTADGKQLSFEFFSPETVQGEGQKTIDTKAGSGDVQRERNPFQNKLRKLAPGEISHVERVFTEQKHFEYFSPEKIESIDDVVVIFDKLENSSIENTFAVYVSNGRATVQHLGIGDFHSSPVNIQAMAEGVNRVNPDKIYFVHNHPSGHLKASSNDQRLYDRLRRVFGDKLQEGIIINLKTGKYGTFTDYESEVNQKNGTQPMDIPVKVYSFDTLVFDKAYNPESLTKITGIEDVAAFISSQRLGERDKVSYLVLDRGNGIVGNFFTDVTEINSGNLDVISKEMISNAITYGGSGIILYGRFKLNVDALSSLSRIAKNVDVPILDVVSVEEEGSYASVADNYLMDPASEYELSNPVYDGNLEEYVSSVAERQDIESKYKDELDRRVRLAKARRAFVDQYQPLQALQEIVEKKSGKKLREFENAYMYSQIVQSIDAVQMEQWNDEYMKPIYNSIKALQKEGISPTETKEYMKVKHGEKRNERMRNQEFEKVGVYPDGKDFSGIYPILEKYNYALDDSGVAQFIEDFENRASESLFDGLWGSVKEATNKILDIGYGSGLISPEKYKELKSKDDYYIPLRGWDQGDMSDIYDYGGSGSSKQVFQDVLKRAEGRTTEADDPIAFIKMLGESEIMRANKNKMKQALLNMVRNNKNPKVYTVDRVYEVLQVDPKTGEESWMEVSYKPEQKLFDEGRARSSKVGHKFDKPITPYQLGDSQVVVNELGDKYVITFTNPVIAESINGQLNRSVQDDDVLRWASGVNRFMSAAYTKWNPEFFLWTNFMRDLGMANMMHLANNGAKYTKEFDKNIPKAIAAYYRFINNKQRADDPIDKYMNEFINNGGETGYAVLKDLEKSKKEVERILSGKKSGSKLEAFENTKVMKFIESLGRLTEGATRFSTYLTSRNNGRTILESVLDAKNVTVNFNKRGSGETIKIKDLEIPILSKIPFLSTIPISARFFQAAYVFFNASIQGADVLYQTSKKHKKKMAAIAASYFVSGVAMSMLSRFLMGYDDDENISEYDKIPEYIRRNNFIIPLGEGKYSMIPLPQILRGFYGLGEMTASKLSGNMKGKNFALEALGSLTDDLSPIDLGSIKLGKLGDEGSISALIPTAAKPLWEVAFENKDYLGRPIAKDTPFNKGIPEHRRVYGRTGDVWIKLSELLNAASGGDNTKKGAVNINPAKMEHLMQNYFGGLLKFSDKTVSAIENIPNIGKENSEFSWTDVPLFGKMGGGTSGLSSKYNYNERLRGYVDKANEFYFQYNDYVKNGEIEKALKMIDDNLEDAEKYNFIKEYDKTIRGLRSDLKDVQSKEDEEFINGMIQEITMEAVSLFENEK